MHDDTPQTISPEDHARVSHAVAEAEKHTSGEIVAVLARRSDGYSDVAFAICSFVTLMLLGLMALFPQFFTATADKLLNNWAHDWTPRQSITLTALLATLGFALTYLLLLWPKLRFWLIPGMIRTRRVHQRAEELFKLGAEQRTEARTGILIYVSMAEHRAEIVADDAIASKVPLETWGEAMADMLQDIKHGRVADGIVAGVGDVGAVLAKHFPPAADDENELPDRLIEL